MHGAPQAIPAPTHHEILYHFSTCFAYALVVLHCLLHMPQINFAVGTADSTAKAQNSGKSWGMCSKHPNTSKSHCAMHWLRKASTGVKSMCGTGQFPVWVSPLMASGHVTDQQPMAISHAG